MERKWNGKKEKPMILANGFGNGMEWKRNGNGILASYLWNLSIGILRSFYQFHLEPFHQIPFHSMDFYFPFKIADLWRGLYFSKLFFFNREKKSHVCSAARRGINFTKKNLEKSSAYVHGKRMVLYSKVYWKNTPHPPTSSKRLFFLQ